MKLSFLPNINLNYYSEYLDIASKHWLNGTCYNSGSLFNIWDLADLKALSPTAFPEKWNSLFTDLSQHGERKNNTTEIESFQELMANLVCKQTHKNHQIDLRDIKYIYGGTDIVATGSNKYDLCDWGRDHNKQYSISKDELHEIITSNEFKALFTNASSTSWHHGLIAETSNLNHRIGYIAATLESHPEIVAFHTLENYVSYSINSKALLQLLSTYAVYIAIEDKLDRERDLNQSMTSFLFDDLDRIGEKHGAFRLNLEQCSSHSLSRMYFEKYDAKLYFFKKTAGTYLTRRYLDKRMHDNELLLQILSNK